MDTGKRNQRRQEELLRVGEQAAEWLLTLEEESADREALAEWLLESPLHTQMFLRATAIDRQGEILHPEVREVLRETQADRDVNVVPLPGTAPKAADDRSTTSWSVGLAATLIAAIGGAWYWQVRQAPTYATETGEQRTFELDDHSVVYLNTRSRIKVEFTATTRVLRLIEGEALFTVRRDPSRPFLVHAGNTVIEAVGTQFNVKRASADITVAVIEGIVQVSKERLTAGESATVKANGLIEKREPIDTTRVTAWRQRQLVFEWAPLEAIAEEFNRYNQTPQLRIEGASLRQQRYTAVFNADDPELLVQFLSRDPKLRFIQRGRELVIESGP